MSPTPAGSPFLKPPAGVERDAGARRLGGPGCAGFRRKNAGAGHDDRREPGQTGAEEAQETAGNRVHERGCLGILGFRIRTKIISHPWLCNASRGAVDEGNARASDSLPSTTDARAERLLSRSRLRQGFGGQAEVGPVRQGRAGDPGHRFLPVRRKPRFAVGTATPPLSGPGLPSSTAPGSPPAR